MGTGWTMARAGAVGAVVGGAAGLKHAAAIQEWKDRIGGADLNQLREGRPLPPIREPPPPAPRKQHGMFWCYAVGVVMGGFVTWLVAFLILLALTTMADAPVVEKIGSAQLIAALVGLFGFVVPGFLIGAGLWLREVKARLVHDGLVQRRLYWEGRENMRGRLARGEWNAEHAWQHITSETMGTGAW